MADRLGNAREIVSIDKDNDLKFQYTLIMIKEKDASIKQLMLNKENLEIQADKHAFEINKLEKEKEALLKEAKQMKSGSKKGSKTIDV